MVDTYACGITAHRPTGNLYDILGAELKMGWREIRQMGLDRELDADQRYAWKALSDPAYRFLYDKHFNTDVLYQAGFFDDGLSKLVTDYGVFDPEFTTTPLEKVRKNVIANPRGHYAVLVTTGGMAPIHNGHLEMMAEARLKVEAQGFTVVGGFFAPGHDSYVGQKYGGTAAIPAEHRCAMVELATQDSDWLDCDPWAARYMPAEINFTDVVTRLADYLNHHVGNAIKVFYVYGSDNAGFGLALGNRAVEVPRTAHSSKAAREGNWDHVPASVITYYNNLKSNAFQQVGDGMPYLIRNEENASIDQWNHIVPQEELTRRRVQLQSAIRLGIAQLFKMNGKNHKVHLLSSTDQIAKGLEAVAGRKTISLDPFFPGYTHLDSTRYFALAERQEKPLFRGPRIGCPDLEDQARSIPDGEYVLVEDDTVTGGTIATAMSLLPRGVKVVDQVILSDFADYAGVEYYDVVDLRDFIVGSKHGGLGVIMPNGQRARVPYTLPFVSLRARAKIPAEAEIEVSRIVWQANVRFFKDTDIKIRDADLGFRWLADRLHFSMDTLMEDFCQFYMDRFMEQA